MKKALHMLSKPLTTDLNKETIKAMEHSPNHQQNSFIDFLVRHFGNVSLSSSGNEGTEGHTT